MPLLVVALVLACSSLLSPLLYPFATCSVSDAPIPQRCVRPEIFAYKKDLDKFLLPFCDTSPTLEDLLPDFAAG
jgi:hypothetical protein